MDYSLQALNSATKYPSILTYHQLGEKGQMMEERNIIFDMPAIATEKIDGTNGRVIFFDNRYFIGSREDLLHARGDLIYNPALNIVDTLKPIAERIFFIPEIQRNNELGSLMVFYFEVYGGNVTRNSKQYTTNNSQFAARLFDICIVNHQVLKQSIVDIAKWRDNYGQEFLAEEKLVEISTDNNLELTPRLSNTLVLPASIADTFDLLKSIASISKSKITDDAPGKPEGIVVRSADRSKIAKIRYEDYQRVIKR